MKYPKKTRYFILGMLLLLSVFCYKFGLQPHYRQEVTNELTLTVEAFEEYQKTKMESDYSIAVAHLERAQQMWSKLSRAEKLQSSLEVVFDDIHMIAKSHPDIFIEYLDEVNAALRMITKYEDLTITDEAFLAIWDLGILLHNATENI